MQTPEIEAQQIDLKLQWSLLTHIKAAGNVYKTCGGSIETSDSLRRYLTALENLAEYVATRCRGSELFQEVLAAEQKGKPRRRGPKLIPIAAPEETVLVFGENGDVSLAG
jgi:hypothetical protein